MRISDWSSDVCSSDLNDHARNIRSARALNRTVISLGGATALEFGGFLNVKSLYHPIFQVIDYETVDWGGFTRLTGEAGSFAWTLGAPAEFGTVDSRKHVNMGGRRGDLRAQADLPAHIIPAYGEGGLTVAQGGPP